MPPSSPDLARLRTLLERALAKGDAPLVVLTGAGISAESGVPTFRGPEGYWTVGSRNYRAEDLATYEAFERMPEEVWAWYLYRRGVCRAAQPNAAHDALVRIEAVLGERFRLLTQNVDGLHLRAGSSRERTYEVHGNIDFLRVESEYPRLRPLPEELGTEWPKERKLGDRERALLRIGPPRMRGGPPTWSRPHVLWFDESYDEPLFRYESALRASLEAAVVVVVGTSGATNLPTQVVHVAARRGIPLVCINADPSPFTELTETLDDGLVLWGPAGRYVPELARMLGA